ncbi:hypothetical protein ES708_21890 [subsurface metagenome]
MGVKHFAVFHSLVHSLTRFFELGGVSYSWPLVSAYGNSFQVLGAHHRPQPLPARRPPLVDNTSHGDELLAGRADAGHPVVMVSEFLLNKKLGVGSHHAFQLFSRPEAYLAVLDGYVGGLLCLAFNNYHVVVGPFHLGREMTSGKSHPYGIGQR